MKKLTTEKCREQFEQWFRSKHDNQLIRKGAGYSDPINQIMWQSWQASREAIDILAQQERGEGGWIVWNGGDCPTPLCEVIDVRWRAGGTMTVIAGEHIWTHDGTFDDIIAYRIIPERATNQNGEQ